MLKDSEGLIKRDFVSNMPRFLVVHWDGKVIKYEKKHETDERLAIVASIPRPGNHHQFLAAPRMPNGTGASMRAALIETLRVWEIPHDRVIGMSWDTTSSNTGQHAGSATLFESELQRAVLWLACRHHVGELHVKHADIAARGAWQGTLYLPTTM